VSAAYALARAGASVVLLEREAALAHHTTGRSAAQYLENYGADPVRRLTLASRPFFEDPPAGFAEGALLSPRPMLEVGGPDRRAAADAVVRQGAALVPAIRLVERSEIADLCPVLRPSAASWGAYEPDALDLDVMALHQGYVRGLRRAGGQVARSAPVRAIERDGPAWRLATPARWLRAGLVVNAAGAWADQVARLAGLEGLGIRPFRRTALTVAAPAGVDIREWPNMIDADEDFYFKPEAGHILISPADETPCEPCDAQPEDFDVALGVDRFERATGMEIRRVEQRWAGLRTFAPDRVFVSGFDPRSRGFFWLAGQGGYGIQSAPALAQMTRWLILGSAPEPGFGAVLEHVAAVAPDRLL
jgi:D-arginine dehydrogenase